MSTVVKDLGAATAYGYAVEKGYTGTEAEFAELMASYATVGQTAVTAAQTATTKASEAATSATTATNKASEAATSATTATNKAAEAQADADAAALDASQAMSAASTATTKATEATTAAATAVSAKDDAVSANTAAQSAKTAAQTAQTGAETAAASVQASAAQIQTNADDISELKEELNNSGYISEPAITWNSGYILANGTSSDSSTSWKKSTPISVRKGYTICLEHAIGYVGSAISAISDVQNGVYTNHYTGTSQQTSYKYTAPYDMDIVITVSQSATPLVCIYNHYSNLDQAIKTNASNIETNTANIESNTIAIGGNVSFDWKNGYISASGILYNDDAAWRRTNTIKLKAGQSIDFTANGYASNVCSMIAKKNSDSTYTPLVISRSGNVETYHYECASDMEVVLSCVASSSERSVTISSLIEKIQLLSADPSFALFEEWGVIGDSFATGVFYNSEGDIWVTKISKSWGQILARESGNTCVNFSQGGLYCGSWLTDARGLPLLLSETAKELYFVCMGINDVAKMANDQPLGTISDINNDFSQNPNTFYGNYGKIIGNILQHAPNAKIVICTIPFNGSSAMQINNAIVAIAGRYDMPCLKVHEDSFFMGEFFQDNLLQNHPKSFMYSYMASAYKRMLTDSFRNDTEYWGDLFV